MLGAYIRQYRSEQGLSLQELADRTGLSPSFLSQVERDVTEPSISSLRRIAAALDVPLYHFLGEAPAPQQVVRSGAGRMLELPASGIRYEFLVPGGFAAHKMELVITHMAPDGSSSDHPTTHAGEEFLYVLSGRCALHLGDEELILESGDSIYFYASIPHRIRNIGDQELRLLAAMTPPTF